MGRDGKCYIVPLKDNTKTPIEIDALGSKSFEVGDVYEISRVCYDNGKLKFQAGGNVISVDVLPETDIDISSYYYLTTDLKYYTYVNEEWKETTDVKNTLYIRLDNLFIAQQEEIDNIYNAIVGFKVHNISCENRGDITLDAWDMIKYVTDDGEYYTLNENELTYNGVCMSKVNTNIPAGKKNETTNIINASIDAAIKRVQTIVNEAEASIKTITEKTTVLETKTLENETQINNNYQDIITQLGDYAKEAEVISIKESVSTIQNEASLAVEIAKKVQTDGVDQITTKTGYTFNEDGLNIERSGAKVKSKLNEAGLDIRDATGSTNESLMFVGYDTALGESIVRTKNLTVNKYLIIGKYSRMEDFVKDGVAGTGMFWVRSDRRSKYMYRIYKLTFPSGKIYIGITSRTIKERIYSGYDNKFIKKEISNCGWESVKKEELYQIENEEDAFQKEIDMIKFYDSTNPEIGYNQSTGGQAPHKGSKMSPKNKEQLIERLKNNKYHLNQKHTEETKRKISELHKGKHHSRETEFPARRVICIQTGEIFESLNMAERATGVNHSKISMVCQGKRKSANGFTWKYVVEEVG